MRDKRTPKDVCGEARITLSFLKVYPLSKIFPSNEIKITRLLYASTDLTLLPYANENVLSLTAPKILPSALTITDRNMINCYFIVDKSKWNLERKKEKEGEENAK